MHGERLILQLRYDRRATLAGRPIAPVSQGRSTVESGYNSPDDLQDVRTSYKRVLQKYDESNYYSRYPLNSFWASTNMRDMRNIIESAASEVDVIHGAQRTFMFSVNVSDEVEQLAVDWLLEEQRTRDVDLSSFPGEVQESAHSYPPNNVLRQGRLLTPDFLRTVNISREIAAHVPTPPGKMRVIELGAGMGHLARTLRLLGLSRSHVIIDIPETLVFSHCFLKKNFPDAKLLLVDDRTPASSTLSDYDFVFVPALFADRVLDEQFDLFINTASMGEMRNEVIRYWMDFIQNRLSVKYLFTLNRYLNTLIPKEHAWRLEENECSLHYDLRWNILKWEVEPSFTRCPYVDTQIARYVEIIGQRLDAVDAEQCRQRAAALVRQVKHEDWYRVLPTHPPVMTMRDGILVHNMTMSGTLFKLWEALRLAPTAEAAAMMLRYLDTLLRDGDKELEEVPYYESLLLGLYDEARDQELLEFANAMRRRQYSRLQAQAPREPERRALLGRVLSAVHRRIREYLGNRSEQGSGS